MLKPRIDTGHLGLGSVVYIRYMDHVLFRNSDPNLFQTTVRESVGWLMKEDEHAVWILWDKSICRLPHEKVEPVESGIIILKAEILELKRLE
jgi:hypothetical protein